MPYKIVLDAGHGGTDPGAIYMGRQEKDDTLELTLEIGKLLAAQGINVVYTRTTDVYQTPFEKAQIANRENPDYFISIHRNSSPMANQYKGVEILLYDENGEKLKMAQNILGAMGEVGFREIGIKERPGLVVLRRTKAPALLLEIGFINSDEDNSIFENQLGEIAESISGAILGTLDRETVEAPQYYRVQTGVFKNRANADRMLYQLQARDYPAFLLRQEGYYKVQVGAFEQLGNAITMEQKLKNDGYSTIIVSK